MRHKITGPYKRYENWQIAALGAPVNGLVGILCLWHKRWLDRRAMAQDMRSFNDAMFEDFSISRAEAQKEIEKVFWRA